MSDSFLRECAECDELHRRGFLQTIGEQTAGALLVGGLTATTYAQQGTPTPTPPKAPRPAEALIRELWTDLTADQRRSIVQPWNHGATGTATPTRKRTYNRAIGATIGNTFTRPQIELLERIYRSFSSGEEGHRILTRNGGFDQGGGFRGCGANFFGDLGQGQQWAFLFTGHHITIRCDGDSEPDTGFGGPIYYGHGADGHSARNVFHFQTRSVQNVYSALNEQQRRQALATGSPGEGERSIQFRATGRPGINAGDLTADQRRLVEQVMRDLLSPFRREDADEVMQIVRRSGGLERLNLAFYRDRGAGDDTRWSFWRVEGPGFVWNYRVLPHVHCYVNIGVRA